MSRRLTALVIGNGAYEDAGELENPTNDAEDIAAKLETCGFSVIKAAMELATQLAMRSFTSLIFVHEETLKANWGGIGRPRAKNDLLAVVRRIVPKSIQEWIGLPVVLNTFFESLHLIGPLLLTPLNLFDVRLKFTNFVEFPPQPPE